MSIPAVSLCFDGSLSDTQLSGLPCDENSSHQVAERHFFAESLPLKKNKVSKKERVLSTKLPV